MEIGTLPDGARGFDCNRRLTAAVAKEAVAKKYAFVMRYVRRGAPNDHDLIPGELAACLQAGLGVGIVQHVAPEGWSPFTKLGESYGAIAAEEARGVGVPRGASIFCDLEGVNGSTRARDVIAYCNAWHQRVLEAGYRPGLYVGDSCILTAYELYRDLPFDCYWSAYNLNRDQYPAVRGVAMRQLVAHAGDWLTGFDSQTMDLDVVHADALGGTPSFLLPQPAIVV